MDDLLLLRAKIALDIAIDWLSDKGIEPEHVEMKRLLIVKEELTNELEKRAVVEDDDSYSFGDIDA